MEEHLFKTRGEIPSGPEDLLQFRSLRTRATERVRKNICPKEYCTGFSIGGGREVSGKVEFAANNAASRLAFSLESVIFLSL